jgi:hypothetical protein
MPDEYEEGEDAFGPKVTVCGPWVYTGYRLCNSAHPQPYDTQSG